MKTDQIVILLTPYQLAYLARNAQPLGLTATGLVMRAIREWTERHAMAWPSDDEA